jgi:hypothetical protein
LQSSIVISQVIGHASVEWTLGGDHPFAAVELVWDRDTDTVYVARCHRLKEATPIEHAAAIRACGKDSLELA